MAIFRWIIITALAMAFLLLSVANWTPVPFRLPDGAMINIRLPLLLGAAFVAGWLPTWLFHVGARVTWKRKLTRIERSSDLPNPCAAPSQAQPIIVPPAGA